ncbi:MAG: SCP2 sterol-binding domain-containing protein [Bacillota bacterium]
MPVYRDTAQVEDVIGTLFRTLLEDPEVRERYASAGVTVQFVMTDPDAVITVAPDGVTTGRAAPADVTMKMRADVAHRFWMGETTLPRAISSGDIAAEGPVTKVLGLLPLLRPAYRLYPKLAASRAVDLDGP